MTRTRLGAGLVVLLLLCGLTHFVVADRRTDSSTTATAEGTGKFPTPADAFSPPTFAARRARLKPLVGDGVVVLFGEKNLVDAWEEHLNDPFFKVGPFRQEENLFYLTGLSLPDLAVIIDPSRDETIVYAPAAANAPGHDDGGRELAATIGHLGLKGPSPMNSLEADLAARIKGRPVYLLTRSDALAAAFSPQHYFAPFLPGATPNTYREDVVRGVFERRFPGTTIKSVVPAMVSLRKILDGEEIAAMRRVVSISLDGLKRGIARVAPGIDEREVAAEIEYAFKRQGAQLIAYGADLQSGPNGLRSFIDVFTSYDLRNRTMQAGEVALIDHSAEVNYYVSDLARTVPVSGRFTPEQRLAYNTYLDAYEAGLAAIKPGAPYLEASRTAGRALEAKLASLPDWLRQPASEFAKSLATGSPGHFLGMNLHIHDDYTSPLVPGQVMAYESAFKIPDRGWRFTAEDVVLVTAQGHEVLSAALPRDADGIERMIGR